ncbi:hypothetical protein NCS55_00723400 [Fusarium keratoplasticum]|nr:hypothetical protein NCS55_00723400 [Fusarium keratoplasticum]
MPFTASDICKILLAIILPPVGVFLERGCGADFLINILLTILGKTLFLSVSSPAPPKSKHLAFYDIPIPDAYSLLTPPCRLHSRYHPRPVHHPEVLRPPHTSLLGAVAVPGQLSSAR